MESRQKEVILHNDKPETQMKKKFIAVLISLMPVLTLCGQTTEPTINPTATWTTSDGKEEEATSYSGSAPLSAKFKANAENAGGWAAYYEWRFTLEGDETPYLVRHEENTDYTFVKAGSHTIRLYAVFTLNGDTVSYTADYWKDAEPITVSISESKLEMPNAFTPNGDDINDIYKAKDGYQSLVDFHATIYNRWGQKLYEWSDPAQGWDGKHNNKDVKQGVYFVLVKATGADGKKYNIRKDVNLLRGYYENTNTN